MTKDELDTALRSWHTINKALPGMNEQDRKAALDREMVTNRRKDVAIRIHQAYNQLRLSRERDALVISLGDVPSFMVKS